MADVDPAGLDGLGLRAVFAVLLERTLRVAGAEASISRLKTDAWTIELEEARDGLPDMFVCRWSDGETIALIDAREADDVAALVLGLQRTE